MAINDALRMISRIFLLLVLLGGGMTGIWYSARGLSAANLSATEVYAILGPSALAFVLFGIFVTAFFSVDSRLDKMLKMLDEIRKFLAARASDSAAGGEGSHSDAAALEALGRQIRQLRNQVESSHKTTSRLETMLEALLPEGEVIRAGLSGSQTTATKVATPPQTQAPTPGIVPVPAAPRVQEQPLAVVKEDSDSPAWRKALNNILEDIEEDGEKK